MRVRFKKKPKTTGTILAVNGDACCVMSHDTMTSYMYVGDKQINEFIELFPDDTVMEWLDSLNNS